VAPLATSDPSRCRVAAIDIGTNAVRLAVAEPAEGGQPAIVAEARIQARLGEGLDATGRLHDEPMERTLTAIGLLKARAELLGALRIEAVATAAVRDAANGRQFQADVERRTGLRVQAITPEREAALALRSARHRFNLSGRKLALADLGGGSLEVSLIPAVVDAASTPVIGRTVSLPLGAVRLTERFVRSDPVSPGERAAMTAVIDRALEEALGEPAPETDCLIGSGGTFNALLAMRTAEREGEAGAAKQEATASETASGAVKQEAAEFELRAEEIIGLAERVYTLTLAERRRLPGLDPSRADIIVAGVMVVSRLAEHLRVAEIWINPGGVREGLLLELCA